MEWLDGRVAVGWKYVSIRQIVVLYLWRGVLGRTDVSCESLYRLDEK